MKKILVLAFCGIILAFFQISCNESKYIHHTEVKLMEPSGGVISTPLVMEIEEVFSDKVFDTIPIQLFSSKNQVRTKIDESNLLKFQKMALDRCVAKHNCEILVGTRYQFILSEDGINLTVIISGYPAKYSKIRPATVNDTWMLNFMGQGQDLYYIHSTLDTVANYK